MAKPVSQAYIIAARRTALGRIGGLHRRRRLEDLASPVICRLLEDVEIRTSQVDEVIVGNATAGSNPARVIALASGLSEAVNATTVDQQDASGLVAVISAVRLIEHGEANVVVAGGAESLSTAPWRIARPRSVHQIPHFILPDALANGDERGPIALETTEEIARRMNISRARQDTFAARSMDRAATARKAKRFGNEIVPLRHRPEEMHDQTTSEVDLDELEAELPFLEDGGTLTAANTSTLHDGAAFVLVVSSAIWQELGCPPALQLFASASLGVPPGCETSAPIAAVEKLYKRLTDFDASDVQFIETSETSAVQAVALAEALGIDELVINSEGGAIARGHPFAAAGAILVVRLFQQMIRESDVCDQARYGLATLSANGGLGVAALFSVNHTRKSAA
ncbi:MAG: thiolase family protein [Hyphomicrobiaceae bacterium]